MSAHPNPFIAKSQEEGTFAPPCGDINCSRPHRPDNGEHYSSDNKERGLQLVEDGKLGPQYGHLGGPRKRRNRRAAEVVAEAAAENAGLIRKAFLDGLGDNMPISIRQKSAIELLKVESTEEELVIKQQQAEFDQMNKGQLVDSISEMLKDLQQGGTFAKDALEEDIIEGQVVEDD